MIGQSFFTEQYKFVNYVELSAEQHQQIWQVRISEDVRRFMFNQEIFPFSDHLNFVEKLKTDTTKVYFAVYNNDNQFVGSISLHPINYAQRTADWGIYINPTHQGKGLGAHLSKIFFDHIFALNIIDKISATVLSFNHTSLKFHLHIGFQHQYEKDGNIYLIKEKQ